MTLPLDQTFDDVAVGPNVRTRCRSHLIANRFTPTLLQDSKGFKGRMNFSTPTPFNIHGRYHLNILRSRLQTTTPTLKSYVKQFVLLGAVKICGGWGVLEVLGWNPSSDPHTCLYSIVDGIHHRLTATRGACELRLSRRNVSAQAIQQFLIALDVQVIARSGDAIVVIFAAAVQSIAGSFSMASRVKYSAVSPVP